MTNIIKSQLQCKFMSLLSICCLLMVSSCNSESDSEKTDKLTEVLRLYKWTSHNVEFNEYTEWAELVENIWSFYFTSDTEGVLIATYKWIDTSGIDDHGHDISPIFFTYTVSGNSVTCWMEDGNTYRLVYNGSYMKMGDNLFEPIIPSTGDWELITQYQHEHQYKGDFNLDYNIGFDNTIYPTIYNTKTRTYEHHLLMGFGPTQNTWSRGITDFGIALQPVDGTVENKNGSASGGVYISSFKVAGKNTKCFTHALSDDNEHYWNTPIVITSNQPILTINYTCLFYIGKNTEIDANYLETTSNGYVYAKKFSSETYIPTRIVDENGNEITGSNNSNNDYSQNSIGCPDSKHPHMIDLGLPSGTKWACCNVGANTPEEYGSYYAWGETNKKDYFGWNNYRWCNGSEDKLTKYCTDKNNGEVDNITQLAPSDDAVTQNWGAPWHMPTRAQFEELCDKCSKTWTIQNGVSGYSFKGSNGGIIFLPAAGRRQSSSTEHVGTEGYYWSSMLKKEYPKFACCFLFGENSSAYCFNIYRYLGFPLRPVR